MTIHITLKQLTAAPQPPSESDFSHWVTHTLSSYHSNAEIGIQLVDEAESATLNETYRHKQGATNILSFSTLLPSTMAKEYLMGDLVICAPLVIKEAQEMGIAPLAHWAHLTVHGCLHLLGYDHETDAQAAVMEPLESRFMLELGFSDPYKEY